MSRNISRAAAALALALSILGGPLSALAAAPRRQDSQAPAAASADKKDAKKSEAQKQPAAKLQTASNKPLAENEDPRLIGKREINKGIKIFSGGGSIEKEVALGRQLAAEVDRQAKFVDDPVITEYINRVGQNIVLHSDAKIPFTIKVIDSDEANAFALPGGFFYVNKGLILAADNEAEVAGVMAHEIAHVASRHSMENMRKGQWLEGLATVGSIFLGGIPGIIYQSTAGFGLAAVLFKFTRGAEEEADRLGVQYLWAAGYDPSAMSTMFEKLNAKNKKKPGFLARTFSTHPQPPDRVEATRTLVARFPEREEYVLSTSEFQRVKNRLMRLSNARASSSGSIAPGDDGTAPGRPTLKRRQPTPDETNAPTNDGTQPEQKDGPPQLKRRTEDNTNTSKPPADEQP
ncbi:MAG TPA: M48 family metallopeptidase [Pyrinomonadaceae bacterium]|nr:M48 family metallopeptidase [Pyrinomonadaceae bacterium]